MCLFAPLCLFPFATDFRLFNAHAVAAQSVHSSPSAQGERGGCQGPGLGSHLSLSQCNYETRLKAKLTTMAALVDNSRT